MLPKLVDPIRESPQLEASLPDLIASVKAQGLEGLVAKRRDSRYEPGQRSGAWQKMRVNRGQDLSSAGTRSAPGTSMPLIFGYYEGDRLIYAARTRNGFTPGITRALFKRFKGLETAECPFANLPEAKSGRWGAGLTAEKMAECRWLKPELVGQFEFLEWTPDGHLRHSRFLGLREDKKAGPGVERLSQSMLQANSGAQATGSLDSYFLSACGVGLRNGVFCQLALGG